MMARGLGFDDSWSEQAYVDLRDTDGGVFRGADIDGDEVLTPAYSLTPLRPRTLNSRKAALAMMMGCINVGELVKSFGVPELLEKMKDFAYCVRSKWAYELVKNGLVGDDRFKKAAVLEDMYHY